MVKPGELLFCSNLKLIFFDVAVSVVSIVVPKVPCLGFLEIGFFVYYI